MSATVHSAQPVNISQALATQLSNTRPLTEEEKIFQSALTSVEDERRQQGTLPSFFDNLLVAKTIEDVRFALEHERKSNAFWTRDVGKTWMARISKYAEYMYYYKVIIDAVATRSSALGAPIWGALAFVLGVLKDLSATELQLKHIEVTLEQTETRFKRYVRDGWIISADLRGALTTYHKAILNFAIDVHAEFAKSRITSALRTVQRTLRSKLTDLEKILDRTINAVDWAAGIDRDQRLEHKVDALNTQSASAFNTQATLSSAACVRKIGHGIPRPSHVFTGRRKILSSIYSALHLAPDLQARTAVYGMGGIGKSQLLQKYASDRLVAAGTPYGNDIVLYINSRSTSSVFEAIRSFMQNFARRELVETDLTETNYTVFHAWLSNHTNWLLVFDDVNDYNDVQKAIPESNSGQILFSTRYLSVAKLLCRPCQPIEVPPFSDTESFDLINRLVADSERPLDKDPATAQEVATFTRGIPLAIEQIVHNSLLGNKSLQETLKQVKAKTELLKQRNISSLHEDNLSMGGIIMQWFETLHKVSAKAEALFAILVYLEPSSIPLGIVRSGGRQFKAFLERKFTYDRGRRPEGRSVQDVIDRTERSQSRTGLRKRLTEFRKPSQGSNRWRQLSKHPQTDLPIDDLELHNSLIKDCGPDTPLGQLFENRVMIDNAIEVLRDGSMVKLIANDTLWIHDLVSEVAKALITEGLATPGRITVLTAATMVYLAFPFPVIHIRRRYEKLRAYLPHLLACHHNLAEAGILNDCCIGPELSHLIASTLISVTPDAISQYGCDTSSLEDKSRLKAEQQISYYLQAYEGYVAGWNRLKTNFGITDKEIYLSTTADLLRLDGKYNRFESKERFGRSAPWRAAQTAACIADFYEFHFNNLERAMHWTKIALAFFEHAFGPLFDETDSLRFCVGQIHKKSGNWQAAYDYTLQCLHDINRLITWDLCEDKNKRGRKQPNRFTDLDLERFKTDERTVSLCWSLSECCVKFAEEAKHRDDRPTKLARAREAADWANVQLAWTQGYYGPVYGPDVYELAPTMIRLAEAAELSEEYATSLQWWVRAITCAMTRAPVPSAPAETNERIVLNYITDFEAAKTALVTMLETVDQALRELLEETESKVATWMGAYVPPRPRTPLSPNPTPEEWEALHAEREADPDNPKWEGMEVRGGKWQEKEEIKFLSLEELGLPPPIWDPED